MAGVLAAALTAASLATSVALGAQEIEARDSGAVELGSDPNAIEWFGPGQFESALARATKERRILMIKGISFGVDEVGARCATKGRW